MRLAVLSDVHGNLDALRAVLADVDAQAPDRTVFLGDFCGYYYRQEEAIALLAARPGLLAVAGNHDRDFLLARRDPALRARLAARYGRSTELLHERISPEALRFLEGLPGEAFLPEAGAALYHGSPWAPLDEYVYPDSPLARFSGLPHRLVLLGHTHHPMDRAAGSVRVVNPGSCGQPRDLGTPSWALVDCAKQTVDIRRVHYDPAPLLAEVRRLDPSLPYLADILRRPAVRRGQVLYDGAGRSGGISLTAYNRTEGRLLASKVLRADTALSRMKGLLGRDALEGGEGLWIEPCAMIHTAFMRFPIDAVFLDRAMRVVRAVEGLKPWRVSPWVPGARSVLELGAGTLAGGTRPGDELEFR